MSIAVLFGGPAPEHDISILTGLQAARGLRESHPDLIAIYWDKMGDFHQVAPTLEAPAFAQGVPAGATALQLVIGGDTAGFVTLTGGLRPKLRKLEIEVCVNCCHGGPGEDGALCGALDLAGITYTGPSARNANLGMDKYAFFAVMKETGIPVLTRVLGGEEPSFAGPYIVKPRYGGSSIGIEVVQDVETLKRRLSASVHFRDGAVIEPYRPDLYDLQLALRSGDPLVMSAIERPLRKSGVGPILSYSDKYQPGEGMATAPRELPAVISPEMTQEIQRLAQKTATVMSPRGVMRIDFLAGDDGSLFVNEVNTIPGSLSHYLFVDPKISLADQLERDISEAKSRPTYLPVTAGSDGAVLRSASAIAAKLA